MSAESDARRAHGVAGSWSRRNSPVRTAATMAPAIGPTIHTHPFGPPSGRERRSEPPRRVHGRARPRPDAMMSNVMTRPIVSPAVLLNGPRSSTAVPKTAKTRKNVATASIRIPCRWAGRCEGRAAAAGFERRGRDQELQQERAGDRAAQLGHDVRAGTHRAQLAGHPQPDRDRRVDDAAGQVRGDRDHDGEHQPVGERDAGEVQRAVRVGDDASCPDEDQCERGHELRTTAFPVFSTAPLPLSDGATEHADLTGSVAPPDRRR